MEKLQGNGSKFVKKVWKEMKSSFFSFKKEERKWIAKTNITRKALLRKSYAADVEDAWLRLCYRKWHMSLLQNIFLLQQIQHADGSIRAAND
jgi:hypothetical protein